MSVSSNMSHQSVSYYGEEMDVEEAIDTTFIKCQQFLNDIQMNMRGLAMTGDQDDDYLVALEIHHKVVSDIDGLARLFRELKSVSKQILGTCPKEMKSDVKHLIDNFKASQKAIVSAEKLGVKSAKESNFTLNNLSLLDEEKKD